MNEKQNDLMMIWNEHELRPATSVLDEMSLRDYFAARVMVLMDWPEKTTEKDAQTCYIIADAMLKARETK